MATSYVFQSFWHNVVYSTVCDAEENGFGIVDVCEKVHFNVTFSMGA